jgi:hypothetical protein
MLTIHLHLVQQLRMSGAVPPLPLYALMTWTRTTLLSLPIWINGCGIILLFYKARNSDLCRVTPFRSAFCIKYLGLEKVNCSFCGIAYMETLPTSETLCFKTFVHLKDAWWTNSKNCLVPSVIIPLPGAYRIELHNLSLLQLWLSDILSPPVSATCW